MKQVFSVFPTDSGFIGSGGGDGGLECGEFTYNQLHINHLI